MVPWATSCWSAYPVAAGAKARSALASTPWMDAAVPNGSAAWLRSSSTSALRTWSLRRSRMSEECEVVLVDRQWRLSPCPAAELLDADRKQLGLRKRGRRVDPAPQAPAAVLPGGRLLVGAVERVEHVGVDAQPAGRG